MKKIMIVIPSLADGGAERVASLLSRNFAEGVETVYALFDGRVEYPHAGRVVDLAVPARGGFFKKILNVAKRYFALKRLIAEEKPDAVLSFMESANLVNILCNGRKAVVSVRVHPTTNYASSFFDRMIVRRYNRAGRVIAVSKAIVDDLADNFGIERSRMTTIYNPANVDEIRRMADEPVAGPYADIFCGRAKVIITAGRLNAQKGHADLLKAFHMVRGHLEKNGEKARLVIMGRGELETPLRELASKLGLSDAVFFLDFQKNPFAFIKKSDLFVLSSRYEGFPNSVIEAMICGVPVVSTDCPTGPAEIFGKDRFGNLVGVGDVEDLASTMLEFLSRDNTDLFRFYDEKLREFDAGRVAAAYLRECGIEV